MTTIRKANTVAGAVSANNSTPVGEEDLIKHVNPVGRKDTSTESNWVRLQSLSLSIFLKVTHFSHEE